MAVIVIVFHLGPAVIAGVFSYTIIDAAHRRLAFRMRPVYAKWLALIIFVVAATLLAWIFWRFLSQSLKTIPDIWMQAMPGLNNISVLYGIEMPFETVDELRQAIIGTIKENTQNITHAGGILTKRFFHVLVGMFIAVLCFMSEKLDDYRPNLYDVLRKELNGQISKFMQSFEKVLGA